MSLSEIIAVRRPKNVAGRIPLVEPVGLNALSKFMDTILHSCRVKGNNTPLSAIIDDYPKTKRRKLFSKYKNLEAVRVISCASRKGIYKFEDELAEKRLKYLVIPDIDQIIQTRYYVSWTLLKGLNNLYRKNIDSILEGSYICASPPSSFGKLIDRWARWMGLMEGIVPFLVGDVSKDVDSPAGILRNRHKPFVLNAQEKVAVKTTKSERRAIKRLAKFISNLNETIKRCVPPASLILFAKSHALLRGDTRVTPADIKFIEALVPFWCEPGGNDCQFYIIQKLPATLEELTRKLPYREVRIMKELRELRKRGVVHREKRGEEFRYKFMVENTSTTTHG